MLFIKLCKKLDIVIAKIASIFLVLAISSVFFFSLMAILLRWAQMSPLWIDPLVRHLVFVSAFAAGILITGEDRHMAIDLLNKYLEFYPNIQRRIRRVVYLVSIFALIWLTSASFDFWKSEMEFGTISFLKIHSSVWVSIIPIGFMLMAYRFFYRFIGTFEKKGAH